MAARVQVKVHPRARQTALTRRMGEAYKLDVAAPPVDGEANDECLRFVAELAGVKQSAVRIVTGMTSRVKLLEVEGISQEELDRRMARLVR